MQAEIFGETADGETVRRLTIQGGGLTAHVLTYGAVIQDLRLERHTPPLALGFERLSDYIDHSPYFGATVGRYANRIANGRLSIDGRDIDLDRNENGRHHLHGGSRGISRRVWEIEFFSFDSVTLAIDCADGEMGYPGNARIRTTYALRPGGIFSVRHETIADQPAPASVAHHGYFNLDGGESILDHELMLAADHFLPTDGDQIPTGEIRAVEETVFDFRDMRSIRCEKAGAQVEYDHNFCLSERRTAKRSVALVRSLHSGVTLEVRTTEPGLQFYAGHKLGMPLPGPAKGLEGRRYGPFAGFCLEAQNWPDAPNHPHFPSAVLRPGETLVQETDYVFTRS